MGAAWLFGVMGNIMDPTRLKKMHNRYPIDNQPGREGVQKIDMEWVRQRSGAVLLCRTIAKDSQSAAQQSVRQKANPGLCRTVTGLRHKTNFGYPDTNQKRRMIQHVHVRPCQPKLTLLFLGCLRAEVLRAVVFYFVVEALLCVPLWPRRHGSLLLDWLLLRSSPRRRGLRMSRRSRSGRGHRITFRLRRCLCRLLLGRSHA